MINRPKQTPATYNALLSHIINHCSVKPDQLALLDSFFEYRVYKKNNLLLSEGQRCHEKFFIIKGCTNLFYLKQNGTEQTIDFAIENWWTSDFMAFQQNTVSQFSIRAVETTAVLAITSERQQDLLRQVPELSEYFHRVFQRAYAAAQIRFKLLYGHSKEDLYHHFNQKFPAFIQRVPQYLLASFLGITPEYLSEIKKKRIS